jgi:hypothetical protein
LGIDGWYMIKRCRKKIQALFMATFEKADSIYVSPNGKLCSRYINKVIILCNSSTKC